MVCCCVLQTTFLLFLSIGVNEYVSTTLTCLKNELKSQTYKIDTLNAMVQAITDKLNNFASSSNQQLNAPENHENKVLEYLYEILPIDNSNDLQKFVKYLEENSK